MNIYDIPFIRQGWQCPRCLKIFGPSTPECPYCNANITTITNTNVTGVTPPYLGDIIKCISNGTEDWCKTTLQDWETILNSDTFMVHYEDLAKYQGEDNEK